MGAPQSRFPRSVDRLRDVRVDAAFSRHDLRPPRALPPDPRISSRIAHSTSGKSTISWFRRRADVAVRASNVAPMRVVCLSDTHTYGSRVVVPDGDLLLHAGDLTFRGTEDEIAASLDWLASLPHEHKVFVAGNHDWFFDPNVPASFNGWPLHRTRSVADLLAAYPTLTYLQDAGTTIAGKKIWGSPWQPPFFDWAFNFPNDDAFVRATWDRIPTDTEILVTHTPPRGILDRTHPNNDNHGCPVLRDRLGALERVRLHVFGHLHESYGREERTNAGGDGITFVNASINTRTYEPINAPIVVDL
jgi:predicted phosphohydrolase